MSIIDISADKIKEYQKNNKRHPDRQIELIANSIRDFGMNQPIVIDENNFIIAGHARFKACKKLGWENIPVIKKTDLTKDQVKAYRMADNRLAEMAENEQSNIADEIAELLENDFPIEDYGLDAWTDAIEPEAEDDDFIETEQEVIYIKEGDLIELGQHRLLCGDSTKEESYTELMQGDKADMVFTDPPYNLASDSKKSASSMIRLSYKKLYDSDWDKDFDIKKIFNPIKNNIKEDFSIYICTSHFLFGEIQSHLSEFCETTNYLCWCKTNPMPSLSMRHYTWSTELINYGTGGKHFFKFDKGHHDFNYWIEAGQVKNDLHPTMKPIRIPSLAIEHSSKKEDVVLDLFLGSGSTLIACEQLNRKCYGIEIDPKYCQVIIDRFTNSYPDQEIKINGELFNAEKEK